MASVSLKNGPAEQTLAKALWSHGIRYHKNCSELPGSPDLAIVKYRIAVFVDGDFWHGYDWVHRRQKLIRNRDYWIAKIEENMRRDQRDTSALNAMNWTVFRFWTTAIQRNLDGCVAQVLQCIEQTRRASS